MSWTYIPGSLLAEDVVDPDLDYEDDWFEVTPEDDDLDLLDDLWNSNERYDD